MSDELGRFVSRPSAIDFVEENASYIALNLNGITLEESDPAKISTCTFSFKDFIFERKYSRGHGIQLSVNCKKTNGQLKVKNFKAKINCGVSAAIN